MSSGTMTRATLDVPAFIGGLYKLGNAERPDRAALAALRRGLGKRPGEAPEMFPVIVPMLGEAPLFERDERCAYLVASLFGLYPQAPPAFVSATREERSLGAALRTFEAKSGSGGAERRLAALLSSEADELPDQLRRVIALLASAEIPVDWRQLLGDLLSWDRPDRAVQRTWATAFWGGRGATGGETRAAGVDLEEGEPD